MAETVITEEIELSEPQGIVCTARTPLILDMAGQGGGKTELIGVLSGMMVNDFPKCKGFIGANTDNQLSQSTLNKVFKLWETKFGFKEYDPKYSPGGHYVVDKIPPPHFTQFEKLKNYYNTISFRNGALVYVGSLSNYKAHDGKEFAWAHLDETKDTAESALTSVILGRLRQFGLWYDPEGTIIFDEKISEDEINHRGLKSWNPCYIHTSPAEGGVDWLINMFKLSKKEKEIRDCIQDPYRYFTITSGITTSVIYSTYWNESNLPPQYIANRLAQLSDNEALKFIYGYPFSKTGGEYFPNFSRQRTVRKVPFVTTDAISLTYDFNVLPYVTQLAAQVEFVPAWVEYHQDGTFTKYYEVPAGKDVEYIDVMRIKVYKEYCMKSPHNSTEAACESFSEDMKIQGLSPDVLIYGDATGRNRIVGLGSETQYTIITRALSDYVTDSSLRLGYTNLANLKRRDLMNRILEDKIPTVELWIDEGCTETIRDLEFVKLGPKGKLKERAEDPITKVTYEKIGHTSDALEYIVCELCKDYLT